MTILGRGSLSQRLSLVFALLLIACSAASVWLQVRADNQREQEVSQRLSRDLASHIAEYPQLMMPKGLNNDAVRDLFGKLMQVNPSVEVYVLDESGRIKAFDAPEGVLQRQSIDLTPVRAFLRGAELPVLGDDPRSLSGRKVFSAAPLKLGQHGMGYVYVILQGQGRDTLAERVRSDGALRTMLWSMALVTVLGVVAGLIAFRLITRPLRTLTDAVRSMQPQGLSDLSNVQAPLKQAAQGGTEIAVLSQAFTQLAERTVEQWQKLHEQDRQRRELFANISHDLRTPLTSLHGYLETLRLKLDTLSTEDRRRYLDIALDQSSKVGHLAREIFELARLEYGVVKPDMERFMLSDLVQDVLQKFELAAEAKSQHLSAQIAPGLPLVNADLAMLERVLVNLLDNAVRATPSGGEINVLLRPHAQGVEVTVRDNGPGIPQALQAALFERPLQRGLGARQEEHQSGGLGLMIVHRILQLHDSRIELVQTSGDSGAAFRFVLA